MVDLAIVLVHVIRKQCRDESNIILWKARVNSESSNKLAPMPDFCISVFPIHFLIDFLSTHLP